MANGLNSAELVKIYKRQYPALQKLIYVLKQFLLERDLNEVKYLNYRVSHYFMFLFSGVYWRAVIILFDIDGRLILPDAS